MKIRKKTIGLACYLILFFASSLCPLSFGVPINLVQNGSFEDNFTLSPWTASGVSLFAGFSGAADGANFVNISGYLYQNVATTPGQTYDLRFAMAGNFNWPSLITMDTYWGNSLLAVTTWNPAGHNINNLGWIYVDLNVVASSTTTRLEFLNPGQGNQSPDLDAVSLIAVPDQTSTFGLLSIAIALTLKTLRRQSLKEIRKSAFINPG
jgi:hypothetical protein